MALMTLNAGQHSHRGKQGETVAAVDGAHLDLVVCWHNSSRVRSPSSKHMLLAVQNEADPASVLHNLRKSTLGQTLGGVPRPGRRSRRCHRLTGIAGRRGSAFSSKEARGLLHGA